MDSFNINVEPQTHNITITKGEPINITVTEEKVVLNKVIETNDINYEGKVIKIDANYPQAIEAARIATEKAEEAKEVVEGFDAHAAEKITEYDANALDKIAAYNANAVEKTNTFNSNATSKTTDFNTNASSKTTDFNTNASSKTTDFNTNASAKTTAFNDNATSKTNTFNQNATDKTTAFNNNASEKTTAFNDNYTEKKAVIDSQVELAKDWATKTDGKVDGEDYSAKYYAQSILPIASDITAVANNATNINAVAGNESNINAVNANKTNIDTVASISSDVTTVSGISSDVTSVASNNTDISAVADDLTNINSVAGDLTNIDSVAGDLANIDAVNSNKANIDAVAGNNSNITAVADNETNINAVAGNVTNINAVNANKANIDTVVGINTDVTTVAGIASDVTAVKNNATNINTVAGDSSAINTVAGISTEVSTVAGIDTDITTVSSISSDVTSVASNNADISAVASDLTNIGNVASDLTNIDSVAGNIANVNAVASNATNINAVNSNKTNIDAVAGNASNINTVAGISSDVSTVAGISSDVTAVKNNATDISTVASDIANINAVAGDLTNINNASTYADNSKIWAEGTDGEVAPLGGTHSSKVWAEIAEQAASGVQNPANRDLSNLTADGQMIIDSQNGTISNCILEIPQDIKLEISSGNLVLKSGSKIMTGDGTQYTTTSDFTQSVGSPTGQRMVLVTKAINSKAIGFLVGVNGVNIVSGATAPTVTAQTAYWYDTTNMVIKRTLDKGTTWNTIAGVDICLPIALVTYNAGTPVSIDQVFNGFGYMGGVVFALPNIELLLSNKFDTDGSLKSLKVVTSSLKVIEVAADKESFAVTSQGVLDGAGYVGNYAYIEVNEVPSTNISPYVYDKKSNVFYRWYGFLSKYVNVEMCYCFSTTTSGGVVTDFTIRQPYEGARNLLTDDIKEQVEQNTSDIATKAGLSDNNTFTGDNTFSKAITLTATANESGTTYYGYLYEKVTNIDYKVNPTYNGYYYNYMFRDKNNKLLSFATTTYGTGGNTTYTLTVQTRNSDDSADVSSFISLNIARDGSARFTIPAPTEDTTSSTQADTVGARNTKLANYQPLLTSGTNIKTINGNSVLGSGDLTVGASRNIGEIVSSTIPLTDAGLHLLDGALINGSGSYADFVTYIAGLVSTYPDLFTTEADWQSAVTTYGVCGKFVYDSVNQTVRLPKYGSKIYSSEISSSAPIYGNGKNIGVTNGTTNAGLAQNNGAFAAQSSCYNKDVSTAVSGWNTPVNGYIGIVTSGESGIIADLSNITTALDGYWYIVIATSTKTQIEVDIDEIATDLNGKADTDLSNVNASGTSLASGWSMPSNRYDDLTLGASGSTYTAPANGCVNFVKGANTGEYAVIEILDSSNNVVIKQAGFSQGGNQCVVLSEIKKGSVYKVSYSASRATELFRFIYAEGENV